MVADMSVDSIINGILDIEGEAFTNDPADSGGPTKWGITHATLARYRKVASVSADEVSRLNRSEAFNCYYWLFVLEPGFDKIVAVSPSIGAEVIDTGVNCGPGVATIILQRCLNAFNNQGEHYPDIPTDGHCGTATANSLRAFLDKRGTSGTIVLYKALNALQGERYIDLCEKRQKDEKYVFGWFANRVGMAP